MSLSKRIFIARFFLILALPAGFECAKAGPVRDLRLEAGRSFGYTFGDLIRHQITFNLDKPYRLEKGSLPAPGPLEKWLELRGIEVTAVEQDTATRYQINVRYQIFPPIRELETRTIPGLPFQVFNGQDHLSFATPAASITVSPLIPGRIPDAAVNIRPAIRPAPLTLTGHIRLVAALCAASIPLFGYLAWRRGWLPVLSSRKMPFASARREIRRWRNAEPAAPEYRAALRAVHRALNATAGEPVFAEGLERFFHRYPAFEPMREKTCVFFRLSEQIFFTQTDSLKAADYPITWLEQLCREYHKIERGAG